MDDLGQIISKETPLLILMLSFVLMIIALIVVISLKREGKWKRRCFSGILLLEYLFIVFGETVFFRPYSESRKIRIEPFWSYKEVVHYYPSLIMFWEVCLNIVLFIPIGLLLGLISSNLQWYKICLIGCSFSIIIEILQFIFRKGLCETDDVINNTLGTIIGLLLLKLINFGLQRLESN